jgi:hypothetical protein
LYYFRAGISLIFPVRKEQESNSRTSLKADHSAIIPKSSLIPPFVYSYIIIYNNEIPEKVSIKNGIF